MKIFTVLLLVIWGILFLASHWKLKLVSNCYKWLVNLLLPSHNKFCDSESTLKSSHLLGQKESSFYEIRKFTTAHLKSLLNQLNLFHHTFTPPLSIVSFYTNGNLSAFLWWCIAISLCLGRIVLYFTSSSQARMKIERRPVSKSLLFYIKIRRWLNFKKIILRLCNRYFKQDSSI